MNSQRRDHNHRARSSSLPDDATGPARGDDRAVTTDARSGREPDDETGGKPTAGASHPAGFTIEDAARIGEAIGIDWTTSAFDPAEFRAGLQVELEHGAHDLQTNVTGNDEILTGKIAWAHLKEFADYYTRLSAMESEAEAAWGETEQSASASEQSTWWWSRVRRDLGRVDDAVYRTISATPTPTLDTGLRRLSTSANRSVIWIAVAGGMAAFGGASGRRAARDGLLSIAVSSAIVNLGLKPLHGRARPDDTQVRTIPGRSVRMPRSASFPSGHSASAFAFATAAGAEVTPLALPLRLLATAVAYSRVHGGAHYPGDTIAGALIGGATGSVVVRALRSPGVQ
jgi:membrane-associated phospholipid phosphatase